MFGEEMSWGSEDGGKKFSMLVWGRGHFITVFG
jgi:hypothetical protein